MLAWFRKRQTPAPPPLRGAPPHPRVKTYSALSGYVYQYYFAGQRESERGGSAGSDYVFHVSADRKTSLPVTVFLEEAIVRAWMDEQGRELRGSHRYAVAKMALRNALDDRGPEEAFAEVRPGAADVAAILTELDL